MKVEPPSALRADHCSSSVNAMQGRDSPPQDPCYFEFVPEFTMTITGKIQKFVVREETIRKLGLKAEKTA